MIKPTEPHYFKFYDNIEHCNIYLCNTENDIDFIPKEDCNFGDRIKLMGSARVAFFFNGESWEQHK